MTRVARRSAPVSRRLGRVVALTTTGVLLLFAVVLLGAVYGGIAAKGWLGADFITYRNYGAHFLATGNFYMPNQYVAPWWVGSGNPPPANLYPPPALYLFVAFTFIPWPLWWGIPLGLSAWVIWWWRPALWSWPIIAAILCTVPFAAAVTLGNSGMWVMAAIALATRWPAASWFLVAKPNDLVLTLPFVPKRGWWVGLVAAALVSLPLLPLWIDWLTALRFYAGATWLYEVEAWPMLLIPVLARLASTRKGVALGGAKGAVLRLRREALRRKGGYIRPPEPDR